MCADRYTHTNYVYIYVCIYIYGERERESVHLLTVRAYLHEPMRRYTHVYTFLSACLSVCLSVCLPVFPGYPKNPGTLEIWVIVSVVQCFGQVYDYQVHRRLGRPHIRWSATPLRKHAASNYTGQTLKLTKPMGIWVFLLDLRFRVYWFKGLGSGNPQPPK